MNLFLLVNEPGFFRLFTATKRLLIMSAKLTTIILFLAIMQSSAYSFAQKINIDKKNVPLETIFKEIRKQSGYDFIYDAKIVRAAGSVNVTIHNLDLEQALKACLYGTPLSFTIDEKTVIIKEALIDRIKRNLKDFVSEEDKTVSGFVTNREGVTLEGATVILKRTHKGTNVNSHGIFLLKHVLNTDTLIVSFMGYKTQNIPVGNSETFSVVMADATNGLDEVVVQAYGRTTQRLSTGDIGTVSSKQLEKMRVIDPLAALQGRVAGLEITPNTGFVRGMSKVVIRGRKNINPKYGSEPLYVIDGVPLTILNIRKGADNEYNPGGFNQTDVLGGGGINPLSSLDMSNIESISVLKDAAATAIYGSRGGNGVIIITTKKGKVGKNIVRVDVSQGVNAVLGRWNMLRTADYLSLRREAFRNDGVTPTRQNAPDLTVYDPNKYTDWQDYSWGKAGKWINLHTSLSGGTDQTTFIVSGGYNRSDDVGAVSGGNYNGLVSASIETHSPNQRFNFGISTSYSSAKANEIINPPVSRLAPNAPAPFNAYGKPNYEAYNLVVDRNAYPFFGLLSTMENNTSILQGSAHLSYNLFKGLTVKTTIGYNSSLARLIYLNPISGQNPLSSTPPKGAASFGNTTANNIIIEPQATYSSILGKGSLNILLGGTLQNSTTKAETQEGSGYETDALLHSIGNAAVVINSNSAGQYKYTGVFASIGFDWEKRYIIDLSGRRDGSSRFGPGKQFGNFGSIGLAWIASDEKWLKAVLPKFISLFKLRGSYGIVGSDGVGDYGYLSQWGNKDNHDHPYNGMPVLTPGVQPNDDFHWQVNKQLQGTLSIGFFEDRVTLDATYYRNRCDNQLIQFPTPLLSGFQTVILNSPANVQNTGIEFTAGLQMIKGKFSWSAGFNVGINRNKLLSYPFLESSPYAKTLTVGESLDNIYVLKYTGVDPLTGQYTFEDHNHDGILGKSYNAKDGTAASDYYIRLSTVPKFSGGMSHTFSYDKFTLSMNFSFVKQTGHTPFTTLGGDGNVSEFQYQNRWQYPGQHALFSRASVLQYESNEFASTFNYTDASYIKLQNLALSYRAPKRWIDKLGMGDLSLNFSAQNIFFISSYRGGDPQLMNFGSQPQPRTITLGLSGSF